MGAIRVCSFEAVPLKITRSTKYADFRAAALRAGRFSVFEATANDVTAHLFTALGHDPTVRCEPLAFPWTRVTEVAPTPRVDSQ